jgi:beta-glucosidase
MRRSSAAVTASTQRGDALRRTQMGYEYRPEALGATLRRAAQRHPGKPLLVTEHGIATADDEERLEFIDRGLAAVHDALLDGLPIRGYIHWSLLDNFEWVHGYRPTFGLIEVDRVTQRRTVRPSARYLGAIARSGCLTV